jgi:hypothetical protein
VTDSPLQDELRRDVAHLAAIERPSASPGEREAAEWIAGRLREAGLEPRVEEERVHATFVWPIALPNAAAVLAAALPWARVRRALIDDVDQRRRVVRGLLPRSPTWNVWAEHGDRDAPRTLVIVAHHDAAHGGAVFDTRGIEAFARRFPKAFERLRRWPPVMWGVVIGPLLVASGRRRLGAFWSAGALAAMADIARSPIAPGANDNAAAVAALLQLATRGYGGVRVILLSTGSEESNADGMRAWMDRHMAGLPRASTYFVALETLGSGNLVVPEGEGFLMAHRFDDALKDRATRSAEQRGITVWRRLVNAFMSDATVPLREGYPTMLLGAIDDLKLPANYHKPTDTADRVDYDCLERAVEVVDALIRDLARG